MRDLNAADESWEILQQFLPDNLEESAREHGAFQRARGEIQSAAVLLRLLLLHVAGGLSLEQAVVRAREHKLVNISAVGLFKRLRSSGPWLVWLTEQLVKTLAADWDDALWKGRPFACSTLRTSKSRADWDGLAVALFAAAAAVKL